LRVGGFGLQQLLLELAARACPRALLLLVPALGVRLEV